MVLLYLLLLEAAGFTERRTFLSHYTFDCSYQLEKKKSQHVLCWWFMRSRRRGKDPSSLPPNHFFHYHRTPSNCSFLALLPLKTLQFVPDNKGGACIAAWPNWNNYCGDEKRGGEDSQTLERNMLSASCCCIWVSHHCGFVLKHFTSLPLLPILFFISSVTQFKGHILCCVCFTCMQGWILPPRPPMCLVKPFNRKIIFFKNPIKSNAPKRSCSISNTLHDFSDDGTEKD